MATLTKKVTSQFKKGGYLHDHPTVPLSLTAIGVSSANLATNVSRHNKDREYQDRQLEAMNRLTATLEHTNEGLTENKPKVKIVKRPVGSRGIIPKFKLGNKTNNNKTDK